MDAPSPQSVGREFVRQYYTLLNKAPLHLHRFYSGDSSFVHGGLDRDDETLEPVHGQQEIHQKIKQLNFRDCKAKIRQVDAHATLAQGVVVQVLGELSNNNKPMRRFMQTFVLAPQAPKKYYVYNDIFRYQDEVFDDTDSEGTRMNTENDNSFESAENEKNNYRNDGIATVSILDGVQKPSGEIHLNGGGSGTVTPASNNPMASQDLSPRVPIEAPPSVVSEAGPELDFEEPEIEDTKEEVEEPRASNTPIVPHVVANPVKLPTGNTETTGSGGQSEAQEDSNADTASESGINEKRTYANLFKNTAGNAGNLVPAQATAAGTGQNQAKMVPTGPLSLPTSGFGKTSQPTSPPVTKEGSPAAGFQGSKSFRGQKGSGGGRGGQNTNTTSTAASNMGSGGASRDRYQSSRESVSSAAGEDSGDRGRGSGRDGGRMNSLSSYPDSHQVFVGNLPHQCQESHLEELFSQFGKVVDVRINNKGVAQSKNLPDGQKGVPNFGFVVFEDEKAAGDCLSRKPIYLPNGHRLNVETKKKNNREDGRGGSAFGGPSGGGNRPGSNFDRGSQEQLGGSGLGRGGPSSSRGNSRGGARGGGRGGFSGGRGSGPPSQGGPTAGNASQNRATYNRKS